MARSIIAIGLVLVGVGLILQFAPGLLNWFGRLPGDIRIEKGQSNVFIPITSMIVISVVLTVLANLFRR